MSTDHPWLANAQLTQAVESDSPVQQALADAILAERAVEAASLDDLQRVLAGVCKPLRAAGERFDAASVKVPMLERPHARRALADAAVHSFSTAGDPRAAQIAARERFEVQRCMAQLPDEVHAALELFKKSTLEASEAYADTRIAAGVSIWNVRLKGTRSCS